MLLHRLDRHLYSERKQPAGKESGALVGVVDGAGKSRFVDRVDIHVG
ncbi:hypothetical protein SAMN05421852_102250 [Thermoflavimicrobium dichotomicum]|uniref:Uncharacterized protein n=1 Tax=Thermoflavimicrobium dichotomicum TaxID=46223 RepID=A0A1I3LMD7_9BACL|nr:hypothetical protein [Thermoflavimicrobium dichotomicum]SFI85873.1 hypothetical protein SAMN05421852_102250 [Thermoflavimicrobium dichotomicum]